jgi:hypothetical protein
MKPRPKIRKGQRRPRKAELELLAHSRATAIPDYVRKAAGFWLQHQAAAAQRYSQRAH